MNECISIPFPCVKLDEKLNIVDYNSIYKNWNENIKKTKSIFDIAPTAL